MALGDGIHRNIAHVSQEGRERFRGAILELNYHLLLPRPPDRRDPCGR
jgi:hypothetical protein